MSFPSPTMKPATLSKGGRKARVYADMTASGTAVDNPGCKGRILPQDRDRASLRDLMSTDNVDMLLELDDRKRFVVSYAGSSGRTSVGYFAQDDYYDVFGKLAK